ncbi:MAG: hypothetical protein MI784_11580, partial [Cytophagales bacterium]|nr:hypothetical protein [Cytophagales bacterium]
NEGQDDGSFFLLNVGFGGVIETNGTQVFLNGNINQINADQQWAFQCNDKTNLDFLNLTKFLINKSQFKLTIPGGQYLALGAPVIGAKNTYHLSTTPDQDEALDLQFNSGGQIETVGTSEALQLDIFRNIPVFTSVFVSDPTPKAYLFDDNFIYLRFENGKYLDQAGASSFKLTYNQINDGTGFDILFTTEPVNEAVLALNLQEEEELTKCEIAWAKLLFHCTGGLVLALGLGPAAINGRIEDGLVSFLRTNPTLNRAINELVQKLEDTPTAIAAVGLVGEYILAPLWATGHLWSLLKLVLPVLGWWSLAFILKRLIVLAVAPEYLFADLLVNFSIWSAQLFLIAEKVFNCKSITLIE